MEQLLDYCKTYKDDKCIIISSHDIESLEAICDCFLIFTKDGIISIDEKIDRMRVNAMIGDSYVIECFLHYYERDSEDIRNS